MTATGAPAAGSGARGSVRAGERPLVAVVVTYLSADDVVACLRALAAQLGSADRLVVVDNASSDASVVAALGAGVPVEVLPLGSNLGFGTACNRGVERVPGGDVLLVNPDAVVQPAAVERLRAALEADPHRGVVGPRIDRTDGRLDLACRRSFPDPATAFFRLARLDRVAPRHPRVAAYNRLDSDPQKAGPIDSGCGAGLLIRREAWDAAGGFDERFFMYGEDLDLCRRIKDLGWEVWYEPAARFVHRKGASSLQATQAMLREFHRAMWLYYRKHHLQGPGALLAPAVAAGIAARWAGLVALSSLRRDPRVSR